MINFIALALAAITVPSVSLSNAPLTDTYSIDVSTCYAQIAETNGNTSTQSSGLTTPNGTEVKAEYRNYYYSNQEAVDNFWNNYIYNLPMKADFYRSASYNYNSFSYAFYSQEEDNHYWIDDPIPYIADYSYEKCTSTPAEGDVIVYYNASGAIIHAGIVIGFTGVASNSYCGEASTVMVRSKWGEFAVYDHKGDECPYSSKYYEQIITERNNEGDVAYFESHAVRVEFYHKHTHEFTNHYTNNGDGTHAAYCKCGNYITESHNYTYKATGDTYHKESCVCGYTTTGKHTWTPYKSGSVLSLLELYGLDLEDIDPLAVPKSYLKCVLCGYIKEVDPGDVYPVVPEL